MSLIPAGAFLADKPARRSKYRAVKTMVDNIVFASKREAHHYLLLKDRLRKREIYQLQLQPAFPFTLNNQLIFTYYADFSYWENDRFVVIDVKGFKTPLYRLKKKLIEACYAIEITEVR